MSYDEKTDQMNWKDEIVWFGISFLSGTVLSLLFLFFDKFPEANKITIFIICTVGFYILSILVRIQNHRGKILSGKTGIKEKYLKFIFPVLGFVIGVAVIFFN